MNKRKALEGNAEEIAQVMKSQEKSIESRRLQCVYLGMLYPDMSAKEIGIITLYSESRVWAIHAEYRRNGIKSLIDKRGGRYRENITFEEETELLAPSEEQSKSGKLIVVRKIKLAYEEKMGRAVAESTIYRMLDRHGFRKIIPFKRHPKANKEEQEAFKKTFRK